jgi:dTDP-4-amino-4,6-dideoxygalactose transaminase
MRIPFNKPVRLGGEAAALERAIHGGQTSGVGPIGLSCEQKLGRLIGRKSLLTTSCTHALEMAALLLDISPGDEVIVPSFTFVSTANAFVLRGARPVFADVDPLGNLSISEVERLKTSKTRAVCVVHYAGNSCDLDALKATLGPIPLVEDAAQALGATFRGAPLGGLGRMACFSFHETKNVGCGEGGALALGQPEDEERAFILRDKGTNRQKFSLGLVDKYTWVDLGSSYVLSELNSAYLEPQLDAFEKIQARRKALWEAYARELGPGAERSGARILGTPSHNNGNAHLFAMVFSRAEQRSAFIGWMKSHGILTPFHYVALHRSPMGQRFHDGRDLPMSQQLTDRLVRLPLFFNMTDAELDTVISKVKEFLSGI